MIDLTFSINMHDKDGDKWDDCVLLHINETFILRLKNLEELDSFIKKLQSVRKEISEN